MRRSSVLFTLALVTFAAAFYCFSGYGMNASFSVAAPDRAEWHSRAAVRWGIAGIVNLGIAICLLIAGWRSRRT